MRFWGFDSVENRQDWCPFKALVAAFGCFTRADFSGRKISFMLGTKKFRMPMAPLVALSIVLLAFYGILADSSMDLPGWRGETYRMPLRTIKDASEFSILQTGPTSGFDPTRVIQLSWRPRAFLYKNFLTDAECDHLIFLARDKLQKSMVADNESGKSVESEIRTSSGMFLTKAQDEIVANIEDRIAAWTFLPKENGEAMQVLHYELGQKYEAHFDYFHDKINQAMGGHRIATVLMYLSDVVRGGETVFPNSEARENQPKDDSWSECGKSGYSVKPRKGDALLFFSLRPGATTDPSSLHGSCPVIEGEKWSATKWIHVRSFEAPIRQVSGECIDENASCAHWASIGECKKNPLYMVGSPDAPGACRKSCQLC